MGRLAPAEKTYSQASQQGAGPGGPGAGPEAGQTGGGRQPDDNVMDADFEEVKSVYPFR